MTLTIKTGNLLEAKEKYIAHQCNSITIKSYGLAKTIFEKFPYANIYAERTNPDTPGNIIIKGDGQSNRYVINMIAQYYPGKPKYPDSNIDGVESREKYFHECLLRIAKIPNLESIAFPVGIGCGIAGGNWNHYLKNIENFSNYIFKTQGACVTLYKFHN